MGAVPKRKQGSGRSGRGRGRCHGNPFCREIQHWLSVKLTLCTKVVLLVLLGVVEGERSGQNHFFGRRGEGQEERAFGILCR